MRRSIRRRRRGAGTIVEIEDAAGTLVLRRGPSRKDVPPPRAIVPAGPIATREQRGALMRLAVSVRAGDGRYSALRAILARTPPRLHGREPGGVVQTIDIDAQRVLAVDLDGSYLFVQGPPGTGKTWTGARLITHLMRLGRRVGVAATSHKGHRAARDEGLAFRGLK